MNFFKTALVLSTLVFGFHASAQSSVVELLRADFDAAEVPTTYDLDNTVWACDSTMAFGSSTVHTAKLFHFKIIPENQRIVYSDWNEVPNWMSRWFAEYQGLRSSVPFKTINFLDKCDHLMTCGKEGPGLEGFAYIRMTPNKELMVEWTAKNLDRSPYAAISPDKAVPNQKALMYSRCRMQK